MIEILTIACYVGQRPSRRRHQKPIPLSRKENHLPLGRPLHEQLLVIPHDETHRNRKTTRPLHRTRYHNLTTSRSPAATAPTSLSNPSAQKPTSTTQATSTPTSASSHPPSSPSPRSPRPQSTLLYTPSRGLTATTTRPGAK